MIKPIILTGLLLSSFSLWSQKTDENYNPGYYRSTHCQSSFQKIQLERENNASTVQLFLKKILGNLKDARVSLKLNYKHESPGGFHYSFTQLFNGVAVYQSEIKLNTDKQNRVHSLFDNSENTSNWNLPTANAEENSVIAIHPVTHLPVLAQRRIENNSREILEANGETIFSRDMNMYFCPPDSLASGRVFNPDPLTTAGQFYGGIYIDNNNADAVWLDGQEQTVSFTANFTGSQFTLENAHVRVSDFDLPTAAPATSANGQFNFDRSQSGFEDVNAFYHINTIQAHIHSLGFDCADGLIDIDTHAENGADNSYFAPFYSPQRIFYGTGGVDDAEDADVCVHEYGHFVSESASPGGNNGFDRSALDEAFGDYLAGSYSRSINTFNDNWVFNWDGHNEFWNGRVLNSTWVYPTDMSQSSYYHNAAIWSAVLWCLNGSIGRNATDSLILQTHYSLGANLGFEDAAALLIDADTLLTGGVYFCPIYQCLFQHGLHPANPFIQCGLGVNALEELPVQFFNHNKSFSIINTGLLKMKIELLNVNGQLIRVADESQAQFNYENAALPAGIYLVHITADGAGKTFKWSKTE